jgi:uncharacterized protein
VSAAVNLILVRLLARRGEASPDRGSPHGVAERYPLADPPYHFPLPAGGKMNQHSTLVGSARVVGARARGCTDGRRSRRGIAAVRVFVAAAGLALLAPTDAVAQPAGGRGPIQVLLVTKGHAYDRAPFFALFDALGETITWTHVEQPAAQVFWDPRYAEPYDVFVHYDAMGRGNQFIERADGSRYWEAPSPEAQANFAELLRQGNHGFVFFHHAISAWSQSWPEYSEVMGGACDWTFPITLRGQRYAFSGFNPGIQQRVSIVDRSHPVVEGLEDGFEIEDETYHCPYLEDSLHPLMRTDFDPVPENFPIARERDPSWNPEPRRASNLTGWVKAAENSPVVYIQHGHGPSAWENPAFQKLMENAIRWAASEEGRAWARQNPHRIF